MAVPPRLFEVVDLVMTEGRAAACWLDVAGRRCRLTVAPRRDPETNEVYGAAIRLAAAR